MQFIGQVKKDQGINTQTDWILRWLKVAKAFSFLN